MGNKNVVQVYLDFGGKCNEALEFYQHALGAEVEFVMRFKDSPEPPPPGSGPTDPNKVLHAEFRIGGDVPPGLGRPRREQGEVRGYVAVAQGSQRKRSQERF